jgi:S1-C subfamily serine protease
VNLLDVILILMIVTAVVGGYRLGFLARATSWIGLAIGVVAASYFLPGLAGSLQGYEPASRFLVAAGIFIGAAFLGQAVGLIIGSSLHHALPLGPLRHVDRAAGGVAGMVGVLVTIWLLTPSMADVPGWPARQARTSRVAETVSNWFPRPPDALAALRHFVGDERFPGVLGPFQAAPDVGPAPVASGLSPEVIARVTASTVKVQGDACNRVQEGSGFVVAPGLVVTNAHVVAGERETTVSVPGRGELPAQVVVFDSDRDLALLTVTGLGAAPLPRGSAAAGTTGAVFGHPGGQSGVEVSPARVREEVEAVGRDLYDGHATRRHVYILAADLEPGDSGGALADRTGRVVGVAFAMAPDRPGTAYALTVAELEAVLAAPRAQRADTGQCLTS